MSCVEKGVFQFFSLIYHTFFWQIEHIEYMFWIQEDGHNDYQEDSNENRHLIVDPFIRQKSAVYIKSLLILPLFV